MIEHAEPAREAELDKKRQADEHYRQLLRYDRYIIYLVLALLLGIAFLQRHALVLPLRTGETVLGILLGVVLGIAYCFRLERFQKISGRDMSHLWFICPVIFAVVALASLRSLVAEAAFIGEPIEARQIPFEVTSKSVSRYSGPKAFVRAQSGGREIYVDVSDALYDHLEPVRHPGRDCIIIKVETGWRGIRRAVVPNVLDDPFDTTEYQRCGAR